MRFTPLLLKTRVNSSINRIHSLLPVPGNQNPTPIHSFSLLSYKLSLIPSVTLVMALSLSLPAKLFKPVPATHIHLSSFLKNTL